MPQSDSDESQAFGSASVSAPGLGARRSADSTPARRSARRIPRLPGEGGIERDFLAAHAATGGSRIICIHGGTPPLTDEDGECRAGIGLANRKPCPVSQSACRNKSRLADVSTPSATTSMPPMRKLNHGAHDGLVAVVVGESGDKRLVDLERADGAAFQVLQAGIAGAEVVGGEAHTDLSQSFRGGRSPDHRTQPIRSAQFQDTRRATRHRPARPYPLVEIWPHLARRNIDGQPERLPCQHPPVAHLTAGCAQHPCADFRHQAGRFDHGQELARRQQSERRMTPAQQGFRADNLLTAQIDNRLVVQPQAARARPPAPVAPLSIQLAGKRS